MIKVALYLCGLNTYGTHCYGLQYSAANYRCFHDLRTELRSSQSLGYLIELLIAVNIEAPTLIDAS